MHALWLDGVTTQEAKVGDVEYGMPGCLRIQAENQFPCAISKLKLQGKWKGKKYVTKKQNANFKILTYILQKMRILQLE